eukprot:CAMPEP_0171507612 /NCGR_PEP_ID=MMETSP0958-20121227/13628_1 /TAXON_ID=87120 /ORGANISM="Aurantiochytrium limacinum, Strain ATCCMYA-1381" /LENGTH=57 /DNA_ID=CAMNT_0012044393 /DNA_START=10 /DNA_END=179 /DNA_ORIENTATION=+
MALFSSAQVVLTPRQPESDRAHARDLHNKMSLASASHPDKDAPQTQPFDSSSTQGDT